MTREELEIVINDTTLSQDTRDDAKSQLAKLDALQTSSGVEGINNDILFAVREFNQSIDKLAKAGVDKKFRLYCFRTYWQNANRSNYQLAKCCC
jgi:homoserine acetyltransferase